jgi:hypothetical protein
MCPEFGVKFRTFTEGAFYKFPSKYIGFDIFFKIGFIDKSIAC